MAKTKSDVGVSLVDYQMYLQNPSKVFKDNELKTAIIEKNNRNMPKGIPGNFASVFRGTVNGGKEQIAIRVFFRGNSERDYIYQQIHEHLKKWSQLTCFVKFKYRQKQVMTRAGSLPLVTMDWVDGQVLFPWLEKQCMANNQQALVKFRDDWIQLIADLAKARIAHGDLQHGNIMIDRTNTIKLVDYDGLCVPALVGREATEQGVDEYQHPQRAVNNQLTLELDRYSALYIFVAAYLLAEDKVYRDLFLGLRNQKLDYLFFDRKDLDSPDDSKVIQRIRAQKNKEAIELVEVLIKAYQGSLEDIPALESVLFSPDRVKACLSKGEFDEAVNLWERKPNSFSDVLLERQILNATARVECRKKLESLEAVGDELGMSQVFDRLLTNDYPAAAAVAAIAKDAAEVSKLIHQLNSAKASLNYRKFTSVWNANSALLQSRLSCSSFVSFAKHWNHRNALCDEFLKEFHRSKPDDKALIKAWKALQNNPGQPHGHPDANQFRTQMEKIINRDAAWDSLRLAAKSATHTESSDTKLVSLWRPNLFNGWSKAGGLKAQVEQARARVKICSEIDRLSHGQISKSGESQLVQLGKQLPANYDFSNKSRVSKALRRLRALASLGEAMKPPLADSKIAVAADVLDQLSAMSAVPRSYIPIIKTARMRKPIIESLIRIDLAIPLAEIDLQILTTWEPNQQLLNGCDEVKHLLPRFAEAVQRRDLLTQLESALGAYDRVRIHEISQSPLLASYQLPLEWQNSIQIVNRDLARLKKLKLAIANNDVVQFNKNFDIRVVKAYSDDLVKYKSGLIKMVRARISNRKGIGLQLLPHKSRAIKQKMNSKAVYKISWDWPSPELTDQCLILVSRQRPKPDSSPGKLDYLLKEVVPRQAYQNGGGCKTIRVINALRGGYVSIWAIIDLGFDVFYSEPLVLGTIKSDQQPHTDARNFRNRESDWYG